MGIVENSKNIYFVEVTDLFCGELNYSWVMRFEVKAKSPRGAISKISRYFGLNFRHQHGDGDFDCAIYHSTTKLTGASIEQLGDYHQYDTKML